MDFRYETVIPNDDLPFCMFIFEGREGNYKVTKHWHQSVEIFLLINGTIDFYINSQNYSLYEYDFVLVNSNEIHSIDAPNPNETIVLQIPISSFEGYMEDDSYINFEKNAESDNQRLVDIIIDMYETYEKQGYGYKLKVQSQFFDLLYLLVTEYKVEHLDKTMLQQKRHLDKLSEVTQYMKANYNQNITLESVAKEFGFTPTYLSRIFQKYANVNYRTYLIDLRVKYAYRELVNTEHMIGDIALEHGFPDSRSFAKAFKKRYGCLPSEYRRK